MPSSCGSVQGEVSRRKKEVGPKWVDGQARCEVMDPDTAQVTPLELTVKMTEAAVARGAVVMTGTVEVSEESAKSQHGGSRVRPGPATPSEEGEA